jgi:Tfp pilus assembly protein PilO
MIKINLVQKKEKYKLPVVLGVDLGKINWKPLIIAVILIQIPDWTLKSDWQKEKDTIRQSTEKQRKEYNKLRKMNKSNSQLVKMLNALKKRVDEMKVREQQVEKIVKIKTNPKKLLERLARDLPTQVWFDELLIDEAKNIEVRGGTTTYKDVGVFIENTHQTPFFGKTLDLISSTTEQEKVNGLEMRIERFIIKGKVITYDPYVGN